MRPRLYLYLTFFPLFSATLYISGTSSDRLKDHPFHWNKNNIHIAGIVLIFMQFFSVFLGGFVAAFIIPVTVLLTLSFSSLLVAVSLFGTAFLDSNHTSSVIHPKIANLFFQENYVASVVVYFVLFGMYSGLTKFMLLVMMCEQDDPSSIQSTASGYAWTLNLCVLFVYTVMPSPHALGKFYITAVLPLIIISMVLLVVGRWKNMYMLSTKQLNIARMIHDRILRKIAGQSFKQTTDPQTENWSGLLSYLSNLNEDRTERSKEALLSLSKLCIIFIILLPYGVCESQLRTTFLIQSEYLKPPNVTFYSQKGGCWVQIINCMGVIVFIPLIALLKHLEWFNRIYSKRVWRVITSNVFILLSILSAAILETIRLRIFWSGKSVSDLLNVGNHSQRDIISHNSSTVSVFYMTPQLLFSSISEILMVTTCVEFLYQQSVGSMKYLAIAFLIGAIGSGGAGDLISLIVSFSFESLLFDASDLNKRVFKNGTCCAYESRLDYWFYCLSGLILLTIIFAAIIFHRFKHYYETNVDENTAANNGGFLSD